MVIWGCAIILVKCNILLHMRWNRILGDNGGIWFLPLWGARKVLTIYFTSVKIINLSKEKVLFSVLRTQEPLFSALDKIGPSDLGSHSCNRSSERAVLQVSQALAEGREDRQRDKLHYRGQQMRDAGEDVAEDIAADKG